MSIHLLTISNNNKQQTRQCQSKDIAGMPSMWTGLSKTRQWARIYKTCIFLHKLCITLPFERQLLIWKDEYFKASTKYWPSFKMPVLSYLVSYTEIDYNKNTHYTSWPFSDQNRIENKASVVWDALQLHRWTTTRWWLRHLDAECGGQESVAWSRDAYLYATVDCDG